MTNFQVGSAIVTRIEEVLEQGFTPEFLFPGFDQSVLDEYPELARPSVIHPASGKVMSSIHSWLVRLDGKTILIDTCSGNGKARAIPLFQRFHMLELPYLERLAEAGVHPDDVDIVICTHLHIDHVGWNTRRGESAGEWVPTFPKARYLFGRAEFDHWTTGDGPTMLPENVDVITDSVMPVIEAGQASFIEPGDTILPGLTVEAAPGHTRTQLVVKYESGTGAFLCSADCLHQPIQIYAQHLNSCFCEVPDDARRTRQHILDYCADRGALLLPMHFGPPHAGHVSRAGSGFRFTPAVPTTH